MKRCPQCNRVATDEALKFCRVDGSLLSVVDGGDEQATAMLSDARVASVTAQTEILHKHNDRPKPVCWAPILLLLIGAVAMVVASVFIIVILSERIERAASRLDRRSSFA